MKLNAFYFETFKRSFDPASRKGIGTAATPARVETASSLIGKERELEVNLDFSTDPDVADRFSPEEESLLQKVFGTGVSNQQANGSIKSDSDSVTASYQVLQGGLNTTNDPDSYSSTISDGDNTRTKDEYLQRFNDHFAVDLMNLESLELKGDPVWLLSPYASASNNLLLSMPSKDTQTGEIVENILQPHTEKIIYLNLQDVEQFDYMEPERYSREKNRSNIYAGFYGIYGSESTFEGGKFTQKLSGFKLAHLNYAGNNMIVENLGPAASNPNPGTIPDDFTTSEWITQTLDDAQKLPQYQDLVVKYTGTAAGFNLVKR